MLLRDKPIYDALRELTLRKEQEISANSVSQHLYS
jgi:hypothetical protein